MKVGCENDRRGVSFFRWRSQTITNSGSDDILILSLCICETTPSVCLPLIRVIATNITPNSSWWQAVTCQCVKTVFDGHKLAVALMELNSTAVFNNNQSSTYCNMSYHRTFAFYQEGRNPSKQSKSMLCSKNNVTNVAKSRCVDLAFLVTSSGRMQCHTSCSFLEQLGHHIGTGLSVI